MWNINVCLIAVVTVTGPFRDGLMTDDKFLVFSFGDVEVREREFLLIKAGKAVPVEPKAFRVLLFLLRNPAKLVIKDEIIAAVWKDCSVSDNSLTKSIATLRRLLGDDAREPRTSPPCRRSGTSLYAK